MVVHPVVMKLIIGHIWFLLNVDVQLHRGWIHDRPHCIMPDNVGTGFVLDRAGTWCIQSSWE